MPDHENHFTAPAIMKGYGHTFDYYRWLQYKPQHRKQSKKLGRWQKMNGRGGFDNCEAPGLLYPDPIPVAELVEENRKLQEALIHCGHEIGKLRSQVDGLNDKLFIAEGK